MVFIVSPREFEFLKQKSVLKAGLGGNYFCYGMRVIVHETRIPLRPWWRRCLDWMQVVLARIIKSKSLGHGSAP